jgi:Zn-dependent M28 family amino/carboxypeptidase
MPFINAGIPAIDLIEFDYPEWHTTDDTPDHCDADSLRQVGETLLAVIYARG